MNTTRNILIGILVLLVLAILAGAAYAYLKFGRNSGHTYTEANGVNSVLTKGNAAFAQAEKLIGATSSDDLARRVQLYQEALQNAEDKAQEAQIKYKLAIATVKTGDYLAAVPILTSIGSNQQYPNIVRAYAVQYLGEIFYIYHDPNIEKATFAAQPYSSFYVDGNVGLTYRHLYEYAASFFPLAMSKARIADWYASDLLSRRSATSTLPQAQIESYASIINADLADVDADVARVKDNPNAKADIPDALLRKAIVIGELAKVGAATPSDAEAAFQQAYSLQQLINGRKNLYWNYHYAGYLWRQYGTSSADRIQATLSDIYSGSSSTSSPIAIFLANERSNVAGTKPIIRNLAALDPKFKSYLEVLGWRPKDFVKQAASSTPQK